MCPSVRKEKSQETKFWGRILFQLLRPLSKFFSQTQSPPRPKTSEKSLRGSFVGEVCEASRPTPRKRVKNESPGDSESQNSPVFFWLRRLIFGTFLGVGPDPSETPSELLGWGGFWLLCQGGGIVYWFLPPLGKIRKTPSCLWPPWLFLGSSVLEGTPPKDLRQLRWFLPGLWRLYCLMLLQKKSSRPGIQGSVNGGFQTVVRVFSCYRTPHTFEKYRDIPPISIAMFLQKCALPLAYHHFVSRCASHLYRDTFAEVLGSGVLLNTPNYCHRNDHRAQNICHSKATNTSLCPQLHAGAG